MEREKECVCIVSHQAVLRALYGYFMNQPLEVGAGVSTGGVRGHGSAWHGMAWHGMARHGTARHGAARHGTARHGTALLQ